MPTLTRWFLRAAMLHLVAGLVLGQILALPSFAGSAAAWRPVYIHLIAVGWATQMIFGVGYWMFPRLGPFDPTQTPWLGWTVFATLNLGLVLRSWAEPALVLHASGAAQAGAIVAAALQLVAVLGFVVMAWRRVRAR